MRSKPLATQQDLEAAGLDGISPLELARLAPPKEVERLSGVSWDTIRRNHPQLIVKISDRCRGVRVRDALMLGRGG